AAEPRDRVLGAQGGLQAAADRDQQPVTGLVTEGVVDRLEGVEVEEQDGYRLVAPGHAVESVLEAVSEERAVRQLRERVVEGLMAQLAESLVLGRAEYRVLDHQRSFQRDLRY